MTDNLSAAYMLRTAFEYEICNTLEIRISQLTGHERDLTEESDALQKLQIMKEYLRQRIGELGKALP